MSTIIQNKIPRSTAHKSKTRKRILAESARLFRARGYDGVGINELMAAANLTRGGFYAHFSSKAELYSEIVRNQHPLLKMLEGRPGENTNDLWVQLIDLFSNYLNYRHINEVASGCTLASMSNDVARHDSNIRSSYDASLNEILAEMARQQKFNSHNPTLIAALSLAVGAVSMAAACSDNGLQKRILGAASISFASMMRQLKPNSLKGGNND